MKKMWVIVCLVFIGLVVSFTIPLMPRLCIEDVKTNELLMTYEVRPDDFFYIEFLHSVNRTLVREYYKLKSGQLLLFRAEYSSFGAGMPEVPEQQGATLKNIDGVLHLDGIDTKLPEFIYRIGTIANHTLYINGRIVPLKLLAPEQSALRFQYRKTTLFNSIRRFDHIER